MSFVSTTARLSALLSVGLLILGSATANAAIMQVADPVGMTQGPYSSEGFEDSTFVSGVTFSAAGGVKRAPPSPPGGTPHGGTFLLSTNQFPRPITLTFDMPASSVGLWFGNDDTCCSGGFTANLDIFDGAALIGTISVVANMNDSADQFLGFTSDELVTHVALRYGSGSDVGLLHAIDDVMFNKAPEPDTDTGGTTN